MPNLVNKEYRDATLQLTNLDLNLVVNDPVEEYSSITKGYVIRTIPEYGETLQEGDSVTLVVSKGEQPKPVKVLSFIGIDIEIVRQQVTQTGLVVGEVTQRASDEPYGTVIDQSINAETQVDAGTTITSLSAKAPPCRTTAMTPRPPEGNRSRERKNTARTERLLLCQMRGRTALHLQGARQIPQGGHFAARGRRRRILRGAGRRRPHRRNSAAPKQL